ncbi:alpha/beta hydrolase [bacterium]|nr:alpha/beta hydrolase [bacterium]
MTDRSLFPKLARLLVFLAAVVSAGCGDTSSGPGANLVPAREEVVDGVQVGHHFTEVDGVPWHWVEAGDRRRPTVVLVHGLPESWWSWHHQIADLAAERHVVAVDLKGFGESGKPTTGFGVEQLGRELARLLSAIGVERFDLVSHDWGTIIAQETAAALPERIRRYVRMQAPVAVMDIENNHRQLTLFQDQAFAVRVLSDPKSVRGIYGYDGRRGALTLVPLSNEEVDRIAAEFTRPGTAASVARLFVENPVLDLDLFLRDSDRFARMDFPVLLLQASSDPNQPLWYFDGATELFPDARFELVPDSGHFSQLERPAVVNAAIRRFIGLAPGASG